MLDVDAVAPADGAVLRWNGASWAVAPQLAQGNTVIFALSPADVWVGGVVSLTHYNGASWTSTQIPAGVSAISGPAVLSSGHIWFAGNYVTSSDVTEPTVLSTSGG